MAGGYSYNGWPASDDPAAIDVQDFGDAQGFPFPGGVRGGDVFTVLGYVATQLHARVEPCISGWCWGWDYRPNVNNPSTLSCHSSATAIDWNAPDHSNGARNTFSSAQVGVIREILNEVQGSIQWGGDYTGTVDEMHFEVIVDAGTLARVAASLPAGGGRPDPQPEPQPEIEDDDMYSLYQVDGDMTVYIAAPGVFDGTPNDEYLQTLQNTGAAKPIKMVSQRDLDILRDSYRRWPTLT